MARFLSKKYPGLTVKFSDGSRVKFEQSKAEVDADTAKRLLDFSKAHPDYQIEQVEDGAKEPTRKERLQAEARERGLDDSGTIADLEARLAGGNDNPDEDPEDDSDEDDSDDE